MCDQSAVADHQYVGVAVAVDVGDQRRASARAPWRAPAAALEAPSPLPRKMPSWLVRLVGDDEIGATVAVEVADGEVAGEARRRQLVALPALRCRASAGSMPSSCATTSAAGCARAEDRRARRARQGRQIDLFGVADGAARVDRLRRPGAAPHGWHRRPHSRRRDRSGPLTNNCAPRPSNERAPASRDAIVVAKRSQSGAVGDQQRRRGRREEGDRRRTRTDAEVLPRLEEISAWQAPAHASTPASAPAMRCQRGRRRLLRSIGLRMMRAAAAILQS